MISFKEFQQLNESEIKVSKNSDGYNFTIDDLKYTIDIDSYEQENDRDFTWNLKATILAKQNKSLFSKNKDLKFSNEHLEQLSNTLSDIITDSVQKMKEEYIEGIDIKLSNEIDFNDNDTKTFNLNITDVLKNLNIKSFKFNEKVFNRMKRFEFTREK